MDDVFKITPRKWWLNYANPTMFSGNLLTITIELPEQFWNRIGSHVIYSTQQFKDLFDDDKVYLFNNTDLLDWLCEERILSPGFRLFENINIYQKGSLIKKYLRTKNIQFIIPTKIDEIIKNTPVIGKTKKIIKIRVKHKN